MNTLKSKSTISLANFLKESANRGSGIRYQAVKATTHHFYIPQQPAIDPETGMQAINPETGRPMTMPFAESHNIHEWKTGDKFHNVECIADKAGECPCCARINDAWQIYNMRIEKAQADYIASHPGCTEAEVDYYIKGERDAEKRKAPNAYRGLTAQYSDEMKMKAVKPYLYLVIFLFETDQTGQQPVLDGKGLPKYSLKVMKLTTGRVEKFVDQFKSSGGIVDGNEMLISYKNIESRTELVGQSSISAVFPEYAWVRQYPGLKEKLDAEAAAFDMTSIAKSFDELKELDTDAVKKIADAGFEKYDTYIAEKAINPGAVYMEYAAAPAAIGAPNMAAPQAAQGMMFGVPTMNAQTAPAAALPNMNAAVMPGVANAGVAPQQPVQQSVQQPVQQPVSQIPNMGVVPTAAQPTQTAAVAGTPAQPQQNFQFDI